MRLIWIAVGLVAFFLLPFLLWGETIETVFTLEGTLAWLGGFGAWSAPAAVLLLVSDVLLPVPATVVMAALGMLYGPVVGGLVAAAGSFLSGLAAFVVCLALGRPAALFVVDQEELDRGEAVFRRWGGWMVALSRWLPILPEAVACMAGLVRMPARTFAAALACGVVPMAFTFAGVGHLGVDRPLLTLAVSALAPAVLWVVVRPRLRRAAMSTESDTMQHSG